MTVAFIAEDSLVALHIVANLSAFGIMLAWPLIPAGTADAHRARARILGKVVTRAAALGLLLGVYLTTDRDLWAEPWVIGPFVILVSFLGIVGGYLTPAERRLGDLAEGGDDSAFAEEKKRVDRVATLTFALAVVAALLMVTKPGQSAAAEEAVECAAPCTVGAENLAFEPPRATVRTGETVSWVNRDRVPHTVTGSGAGPRSRLIGAGETYRWRAGPPGRYRYACTIHPGMQGELVVVR